MSIKPMHQTGALVLKESIVFVRSRVSCNDQRSGRTLRSRLQVMGGSVRPRRHGLLQLTPIPREEDHHGYLR